MIIYCYENENVSRVPLKLYSTNFSNTQNTHNAFSHSFQLSLAGFLSLVHSFARFGSNVLAYHFTSLSLWRYYRWYLLYVHTLCRINVYDSNTVFLCSSFFVVVFFSSHSCVAIIAENSSNVTAYSWIYWDERIFICQVICFSFSFFFTFF